MRTLLVLMVLISGCSSTSVTRLSGTGDRAAKPENCEVQVLFKTPERKHENLCYINRRTAASVFAGKDLGSMLPFLKAEACKCGADAVVISSVNEGTNWAATADPQGVSSAFAIGWTP